MMNRRTVALLTTLGLTATMNAYNGSCSDLNVKSVQELESLISKNDKVFVSLGADWCIPCKQLEADWVALEPESNGWATARIDVSDEQVRKSVIKEMGEKFDIYPTDDNVGLPFYGVFYGAMAGFGYGYSSIKNIMSFIPGDFPVPLCTIMMSPGPSISFSQNHSINDLPYTRLNLQFDSEGNHYILVDDLSSYTGQTRKPFDSYTEADHQINFGLKRLKVELPDNTLDVKDLEVVVTQYGVKRPGEKPREHIVGIYRPGESLVPLDDNGELDLTQRHVCGVNILCFGKKAYLTDMTKGKILGSTGQLFVYDGN